jgi:hypothetical protein
MSILLVWSVAILLEGLTLDRMFQNGACQAVVNQTRGAWSQSSRP